MRRIIGLAGALVLGGCVAAQPTQSGFLGDAALLSPPRQEGAARLQSFRDEPALLALSRVAIAPSRATQQAQEAWTPAELAPLLAEIDAELCRELSERFEITDDPAAIRVRAAVTAVARTGQASSLVAAAASQAIPGPGSVRLPFGLGGLSAEAVAEDPVTGAIVAQLTWARRAQLALDAGSLSPIGDAHRMAEPFADAFGRVLAVEGASPAAARNPERCPGFAAADAGRFIAARLTGLHMVPAAESPDMDNSRDDPAPSEAGSVQEPGRSSDAAAERPET